ncbi:MAG: biotin transporter BioY [Ruminococcaceae bacterium]|jgi:biotin transport system substrate-specific component|nr:biotin transporter BioY [Oscillospiraceae bacterium]
MPYREKIRNMTLISFFTVLAIVSGKVVIPLLVIPFTLQTAVCMMTGLVLGGKRAVLAQGLYLFMGLAGLPVFSAGGGPAYLLQPSFGYLPGMMLAAGLTGWLTDQIDPLRNSLKKWLAFLINILGLFVVYLFGVGYLYVLRNIIQTQSLTLLRALQTGMLPYLLTDGVYAVVLAITAPYLRRISRPFVTDRPAATEVAS